MACHARDLGSSPNAVRNNTMQGPTVDTVLQTKQYSLTGTSWVELKGLSPPEGCALSSEFCNLSHYSEIENIPKTTNHLRTSQQKEALGKPTTRAQPSIGEPYIKSGSQAVSWTPTLSHTHNTGLGVGSFLAHLKPCHYVLISATHHKLVLTPHGGVYLQLASTHCQLQNKG